ncbi:MAG: tetratricopeptide repeat protein [Candidatus Omnitrophica bacterium]|nr:tetratricopeptide repeat protein [Candidatus Omnitrophota bacterium]
MKKKNLIVLLLIGILLCTPFCLLAQDASGQIRHYKHREGIDYAAKGEFKEAEEWFKKNLESGNKDATSLGSLSVIRDLNSGKITDKYAISFFKALNLLQDGKTEEGIAHLKAAIGINPDYARAYNVLAMAYASLGQNDSAIQNFQKAIEINPQYSEASFNLAALYQSLGNPEEALKFYAKAIKLAPASVDALTNSAAIYASLGKFKEAAQYYQEAVKKDPANPDIYYNLALVYFMSDQLMKFQDNLMKAQELYKQRQDEKGLQKVAEYMEKIKEIEKRIRHGK